MIKRADQPARRTAASNRGSRRIPTPLIVLLAVWLGVLLNAAINAATSTQTYPGPLRLLQRYPWQAVLLLTVIVGLAAWWQWQRDRSDPGQPGSAALPTILGRSVTPTMADLARTRRQLLGQVRRTWIEEVLHRSLADVARIDLGLAEQPGAIVHPWAALLRQSGDQQPLPPGTPIREVADRVDAHLLVLGAPGAGKTTLLLEYVRDLLGQADYDPQAPIPVVFHLSAWPATRPPLAEWLVDELRRRYGVSRFLAEELVDRERLAVLLDGLDEVPAGRRAACVAAINAYRGEHGQVPLAVCARTRDYHELAAKLTLTGAVEVQPLDQEQVRDWLQAAGPPLAGLREALHDPAHWLWELLKTPLLLWVATLAYRGQPTSVIAADGGVEQLLDVYVDAMLTRPRAPVAPEQERVSYPRNDTIRWLGWLARRMGPESEFSPDWMQPDWLPTRGQRWLVTTGFGIAAAVGGGLAVGSAVGLVGLGFGPAVGLGIELGLGLSFGLAAGLSAGLGAGLGAGLTRRGSRIKPVEQLQWSWRRGLAAGLSFGLGAGLSLGTLIGLGAGLGHGVAAGLGAGLGFGVAAGLAIGFQPQPSVRPASPCAGMRTAIRTARILGLATGLAVGLGAGLGVGLGLGVAAGLSFGMAAGLSFGLTVGLGVGLSVGLSFGLAVGLRQGGATYLRHRLLCTLLQRDGLIPPDLLGFLDYADSRILLRRAGGGYLFTHRLLQDHLARHDGHGAPEGRS